MASLSRRGGSARLTGVTGARAVHPCVHLAKLRVAPLLLLAVLAAVGPAFAASAASAMSAAPAPPVASAQSQTSPALTVVAQTSWVKPGELFGMNLAIGSKTQRSQLGIALSVYSPPEGQSSFEQTLAGNTSGEPLLTDTPTIPLTTLSTDTQGDVDLRVGITAGDSQAPASSLELNLECEPLSCGGVYPLRVQLMNTATGSVIGSLITHIVFVESNVSSKLRVALVVPVGSAPTAATSNGEPGAPTGSGLGRISTLVNELDASPAPVTVLPQPQSLQAWSSGSATAKSIAAGVASISDNAGSQVMGSPYVWVDPDALVDAGLTSELSAQNRRGAAVLDAVHVQTSGSADIVYEGLDNQTLATLAESGVTQVVLPSSRLESVSGQFAGPSVQTFELGIGHGKTIEGVQTDPDLQSELTDQQDSGGVLAAHQLLADLALIAFEEPDAPWVRGVVLAPSLTWSPTPTFLSTLLSGLASIPVVDPVTLSSFFAQVSLGNDGGNPQNGDGWPLRRQLASGEGPVAPLAASAFAMARTKLSALKSVVGGAVNLTALGDDLLSAESVLLSLHDQRHALSALDKLVAHSAEVVSLTAYHTIRLTSQTATIPITLVREVPYPVTVVLHLSSDKLGFLHGTNPRTVTLTQHLQSVDVDVFARTAGDFPVVVTVRSPTGGLLITSATFTVRSLSTSVVAIVLSGVRGRRTPVLVGSDRRHG